MKPTLIVHEARKTPPVRSKGDPRLIRKVTLHVERHLGRVENVFHDLGSDTIHLDMLWVEPGPQANFHTFVTCGMSEKPIPGNDAAGRDRYAELLLRLPVSWPLDLDGPRAAEALWPLIELDHLARLPHIYDCRLWGGHTVGNGTAEDAPLEPLAPSTKFCGSVLSTPDWTPARFRRLHVDKQRKVRFFSVIPLYPEELLLARDHGAQAVLTHLEHAGVTDLLDPGRPNLLAHLS